MGRHAVDAPDPSLPNKEVVSFLPPTNLFRPTWPENLSWEEKKIKHRRVQCMTNYHLLALNQNSSKWCGCSGSRFLPLLSCCPMTFKKNQTKTPSTPPLPDRLLRSPVINSWKFCKISHVTRKQNKNHLLIAQFWMVKLICFTKDILSYLLDSWK